MIKVDPPMERKDLSRNLVINIVDEADGQATVGSVAEQLGVDPSAASRMVSELISPGFVERLASQRDGRRTVLRLTPDGVALRDRYRRQHRQAFEHITRDWPPRKGCSSLGCCESTWTPPTSYEDAASPSRSQGSRSGQRSVYGGPLG